MEANKDLSIFSHLTKAEFESDRYQMIIQNHLYKEMKEILQEKKKLKELELLDEENRNPMSFKALLATVLVYLSLAGFLTGMMYLMSHEPSAAAALQVLVGI